MEASQSVSHVPFYEDFSPSQSPPSALSSGKIAAIAIGTVLAVGIVCLLLFCPQILFAYLKKSRQKSRSSGNKHVALKDVPPQRPDPVRGNDGSGNGADDAESRRRRSEAVLGSTQANSNRVTIRRRSGSHVSINNNIHINLNDLLHPPPALDSRRNRDATSPRLEVPRSAQRAPKVQHSGDTPNGDTPLPRRRRDSNPTSLPRDLTSERSASSAFWNVENWAQGIPPGQPWRSSSRQRPDSVSRRRMERRPASRGEERERSFDVPGAFPVDEEAGESFELVTAPERVSAPGKPVYGDEGFWVRGEREREGRRGRERCERGRRRERDGLEREDRRGRREGEERMGRRERLDEGR